MSETNGDFPEWFLEAERGAAILEEQEDIDGAARVRYGARVALAAHRGAGLVGENGSTQLSELEGRVRALIKGGNHERE